MQLVTAEHVRPHLRIVQGRAFVQGRGCLLKHRRTKGRGHGKGGEGRGKMTGAGGGGKGRGGGGRGQGRGAKGRGRALVRAAFHRDCLMLRWVL